MVDVFYVETRKKIDSLNLSVLDSILGKTISLAATVQYLDILPTVQRYLEKRGHNVVVKDGAYYKGHVVGCQAQAFDLDSDDFLLLCDGSFHGLNNALLINKEINVFNGESLIKIEQKDLDKYYKEIKLKQNKFLINNKVGLLISNKMGQKSLSSDIVKNNIEKLGKKLYIFECDNVDIGEFENFNDIKIFVNTACFGLGIDDKRIINLHDIIEFLK